MKTIAILGAAGRVGEAAAKAFLDAGWTVRGFARGAKLGTLLPGVEPVQADAYDRDALVVACAGADIILHALNPRYDEWNTTVLPLARNVLEAAKANGATVLIPGNVYNYGDALGVGMTETTPFRPREDKGRLRVQLEDLFREAADDGVRTIVLRGGDYFGGARLETWFDLMVLKDLRKNRFTWPGPRDAVHAFAYLPDFAATMVPLAEKRDALPSFATLNFAGHGVTGNEVLAATQKATGHTLKAVSVPWTLLSLLGLFNRVLKEVVKMRYLWDVPHSMDDSRLQALIGDLPHTPLEEALRQTIIDQKLA